MARLTRISAPSAALGRLASFASCLAIALTVAPAGASAETLVLQLHREPQFEISGYYAALWKGFYREAGLEVEIKLGAPPNATPVDPVREVVERRAQFGTGTSELLIHFAQGAPLLLLAPIFQQSGAAIYYSAGSDFPSPAALLNAKLGRLPATNVLDLELRSAFAREGIDPEKLNSITIEPARAIDALADRKVDAIVGSAWELPWQAQERSVALKSLALGSDQTEFYGDGLFTLKHLAAADPAMVQRFREASIKGWEYALQHPDEISGRIVAQLPVATPVSDPAGFARYQSDIARKLAQYPAVPLGTSDPERWSRIQQSLMTIRAISHPADLAGFFYDPDAVDGSARLRLVILIPAIAVALLFIRRRARRMWCGLMKLRATTRAAFDGMLRFGGKIARSIANTRLAAGPFDLNRPLRSLDHTLQQELRLSIHCRLSLQSGPWHCMADPDAVIGLVHELVTEAAADMPQGGELVVGTRRYTVADEELGDFPGSTPGDFMRVTVKDSGHGLSAEALAQVFYPKTTTRPAAAVAWRITQALGGFAAVESVEGVGTAVHLFFRRADGSLKSVDLPVADDFMKAAE